MISTIMYKFLLHWKFFCSVNNGVCLLYKLILILLTWRIWWAPKNASRWQTGFNSSFKGLNAPENFKILPRSEPSYGPCIRYSSEPMRSRAVRLTVIIPADKILPTFRSKLLFTSSGLNGKARTKLPSSTPSFALSCYSFLVSFLPSFIATLLQCAALFSNPETEGRILFVNARKYPRSLSVIYRQPVVFVVSR